jgi:hypothetical protein
VSRLFAIDDIVNSDDWYTPAWVFDGMDFTFDLDVAAPDGGIPWVTAQRSLSESDDGLTTPWFGWVWCNPPYSAPTQWCRKWATHQPGGAILLRADLSTSGPHAAVQAASSIYVPPKRLQFVSGAGAPSGAVNFSTVILGRGAPMDDALQRLARNAGGCARVLK